jgi:hypothetical protein
VTNFIAPLSLAGVDTMIGTLARIEVADVKIAAKSAKIVSVFMGVTGEPICN